MFSVDYLATNLVYVSILVVFACGVVVIYGVAGIFSLGHQGLMALGAYGAVLFTVWLAPDSTGFVATAVWLGSLLVAILAAVLGGVLLLGPALRLRGDYMALATLAFGEIIYVILLNTEDLGGAGGIRVPSLLPRASGDRRTWVLIAHAFFSTGIAAATVMATHRLARSRLGMAVRAMRDDELAARCMGLSRGMALFSALVVGGAMCGLAGFLHAHFAGHISPRDFDFLHGAMLLLFVVLGGNDNAVGAMVAVVSVYVIELALKLGMFGALSEDWGASLREWKDVILCATIVVLLVWRPGGILKRSGGQGRG